MRVENSNCCGDGIRIIIKSFIRSSTKPLSAVVMLGYFLLWVMMPTNSYYLHWFPRVLLETNSDYFGHQGGSILLYTFPVVFVAALGCLYLHVGKGQGEQRSDRMDSWRQPAIVRGPLGIVSWTELAFLMMFAALLVWSVYSYGHSMFRDAPKEAKRFGIQVSEAKLESSALLLGLIGNMCITLLFFPVTRGSSVLRLIGITSEASIKYHIWLGHTAMAFFAAHGLCYVAFWTKTHQISEMLKWDKVGVSNLAGEVSLLAGLVMWATAFPRIRRKLFELFFYTHHLYIVFIVFFVLHVGFSTACIMLPGYLFVIDRYLRFLQSRQHVRLISARILPCQAVELNFSKNQGLSYKPTSYVFVNLPTLSRQQWHPFSIISSSSMEPDKLSILVKSEGSWSKSLYHKLSMATERLQPQVSIEGPYGPPTTDFLRHDLLVMISGGSGITPFISITRELLHSANIAREKTPRLLLIWSFKTSRDLSMLELLLPVLGTSLDVSQMDIQIEAFVTRESSASDIDPSAIKNIHFNPSSRDTPMSAVLGPRSWLWLGLIISSSFVLFLLFIGIITRYYLYPTRRAPDAFNSDSGRAALYLMFMCISIASTATAAFLWNKKHITREIRQVQNTETPPMATPAPTFHDMDQELESFPRGTFREATRVHYGKRPNLKKILLDCEGSSIGVLVSGPKKMRQETAAICSSSLAYNLHFESISFSW